MWFLADFGIVGLSGLLGIYGMVLRGKDGWPTGSRPRREQPVALALLLAHAAMLGLAMGIEAFYQRHWWLVFGLIASSYRWPLAGSASVPAEVKMSCVMPHSGSKTE